VSATGLEPRLTWVYGSPRTGSTWLLELLCHPLALSLDPESELGFTWPDGLQEPARALPIDGLQISAHVAPAVFGHSVDTEVMDEGDRLLPRTLNRQAGERGTYLLSAPYAEVWRPAVRELVLARLGAVVSRARAAGLSLSPEPQLVIKEVDDSHAADVVLSLFPRSRMIFLVRDGRDVLDSLLDANRPTGWLSKVGWGTGEFASAEARIEWIARHARNWVARMNACLSAYEAHDAELRTLLRYEDLRADTERHVADLRTWLGLNAAPDRVTAAAAAHSFEALPESGKGPGKFRRRATPGGWREGLNDAEQQLAQQIMGGTLRRFGYEA
jgi:hypothetical protein